MGRLPAGDGVQPGWRGLLAGGVLLFAGCAEPLPPERAGYVGQWSHPEVRLLINQDGTVHYRRVSNGSKTTLNGPLKGFEGDDFEVGVGPISATFDVSAPPQQRDGRWIMVVDGRELVRSATAAEEASGEW